MTRRRAAAAAALFAALPIACTRSNDRLTADLERAATAQPRAHLDALFEPPARLVKPATRLRPVTLPLLPGPLPLVTGSINGVSLRLLLDTGTNLVNLSGNAARRSELYLPRRPPVPALAPGATPLLRLGAFNTLSLGPQRFGAGIATVALQERRARGAYAVIGTSVLCHYRLTLDFAQRRAHFAPHRQPARNGVLFVQARIGAERLWLLVDTGAGGLFLEPWAAARLGLIDADAARNRTAKPDAVLGRRRHLGHRLKTVEVAGRRFRDVSAGIVHTFHEPFADGARPAGLLGLAHFGPYIWSIDFGARELTVEAP